ncbi:peroxiredoxin [Methylotenera sp. L2L1]|uniref:peroxiredoxin n=1 Tax=Methylotenera sp. L2L1 TaxID=1502770 RepID=UPI00055F2A3E|nr:peroxiredoxin [Methylotenera sp. L2L1]
MLIKVLFYVAIILVALLGYRHYASMQPSLTIGENAPEFGLKDTKGSYHSLSDYKGKYVVLYFYPKDDTPGCTKEACNFRDDLSKLEQLNAKVIGISVDSEASHQKFAEKYHLPFTLLADIDGSVANTYHALTNLIFTKIAKRYTFLIDPNSKVVKIYHDVNVSNHSQQIIDDLKNLQATAN